MNPRDADVVLVLGPPAEHLDYGGKGCTDLLAELGKARPRVAVCSHIHAGRGHELLLFDRAQEWYENVELCRNWMLSIAMLSLYTVWMALISLMHKPKDAQLGIIGGRVQPTWLVNAAIAGDHGHSQERKPYIVLL